jgi:hypothetical protein
MITDEQGVTDVNRRQVLIILRLFWWSTPVGYVALFAFAAFVVSQFNWTDDRKPLKNIGDMLLYLSMIMVAVCIPLGFFARGQAYKRHWEADCVTPVGYLHGNIMFMTIRDVPVFFCAVAVIFAGTLIPYVLPSVIPLAVHLLNYPHGRPMQADEPRFDNDPRV